MIRAGFGLAARGIECPRETANKDKDDENV
jgi:hypothetical protein